MSAYKLVATCDICGSSTTNFEQTGLDKYVCHDCIKEQLMEEWPKDAGGKYIDQKIGEHVLRFDGEAVYMIWEVAE